MKTMNTTISPYCQLCKWYLYSTWGSPECGIIDIFRDRASWNIFTAINTIFFGGGGIVRQLVSYLHSSSSQRWPIWASRTPKQGDQVSATLAVCLQTSNMDISDSRVHLYTMIIRQSVVDQLGIQQFHTMDR